LFSTQLTRTSRLILVFNAQDWDQVYLVDLLVVDAEEDEGEERVRCGGHRAGKGKYVEEELDNDEFEEDGSDVDYLEDDIEEAYLDTDVEHAQHATVTLELEL